MTTESTERATPPVVSGQFLGMNANGVMLYGYVCPECGKRFRDCCPELSAPSICHLCLIGENRGAAHSQPSGRRRMRHRSRNE